MMGRSEYKVRKTRPENATKPFGLAFLQIIVSVSRSLRNDQLHEILSGERKHSLVDPRSPAGHGLRHS